MTLLVLGKSGQVARALAEQAGPAVDTVICWGRDDCDVSDTTAVQAAIAKLSPRAVINASAYTAVDAAETDQDAARRLNCDGPAAAAVAAKALAIPFIHLSTDYVFDGTKDGAYVESDTTNPLNHYGLTKRDGENAVMAAHGDAVILRTSWVYAPTGKNFVRTMLTLAQSRDALSIVNDQFGAPTSAHDIARACLRIVDAKRDGAAGHGLYHMTGAGTASWQQFAETIFAETAPWRGGKVPAVTGIATSDYPTPARRPLNSRLNCDRLAADFSIRLPAWQDSLRVTLDALAAEFGAHT